MEVSYLQEAAGGSEWPHIQWPDVFTHLQEKPGVFMRDKLQASPDHISKDLIYSAGNGLCNGAAVGRVLCKPTRRRE